MDMSIGLRSPSGELCSLALSFNNDGPFGTWFRYIGDTGTYVARYDELVDGYDKPIDLLGLYPSLEGYELQNREFFDAIDEGREPNASVAQSLPAMQTLDRIERILAGETP
jgi:2-hydroxy-4-carboxymuconate semialdehyde hemiacetal dehydrogenase